MCSCYIADVCISDQQIDTIRMLLSHLLHSGHVCLALNHLGSLMPSLFPRLPVYAVPCLRGQCRPLHMAYMCRWEVSADYYTCVYIYIYIYIYSTPSLKVHLHRSTTPLYQSLYSVLSNRPYNTIVTIV